MAASEGGHGVEGELVDVRKTEDRWAEAVRQMEALAAVRGEPMPPTRESGQGFIYVDPTKNGSGSGSGRRR